MVIYNLDTSILLDFYLQRSKSVLKLIEKIILNNDIVIFSDLHIKELKNVGYTLDEISIIFRIFKFGNIRRVHIDRIQKEEMSKLALISKVPKGDILHCILARDNDAIMVTRDYHFHKLREIVEIKTPEDLI